MRRRSPRPRARRAVVAALCALGALALAPAAALAAASVELQAEATRVGVGQVLRVRYGVSLRNESAAQVSPLNFGGLQLLSDPSPPNMPNFFGSGGAGFALTMQTSTDYMVRAPRPGRYVISGARVLDQRTGRAIAVAPDLVLIAGGDPSAPEPDPGAADPSSSATDGDAAVAAPPPPPPDPDAPPEGDLTGALYHPTAFLRVGVDNPRPWLGQQTVLRAWVYTASTEANCEVSDEPTLQGFFNQSLLPLSRECATRWFSQNLNGRFMAAGLVRRIALFPSQTGRLTIGRLGATVDVLSGGLFRSVQRVDARSPELSIEVREPPVAGRPPDYVPGTVGPLELSAALDRDAVRTGETAVLTVTARSPNALASARVAPPAHVDGLRVREGDARSEHEVSPEGRLLNTLRVEFLLVPERPGSFALGSVSVPYWDAEHERYERASAALPALRASGAALAREGDGREGDPLAELRGFRADGDGSLEPPASWVPGGRGALGLGLAPPFALALGASVASALRRARSRRADERAARAEDPRAMLDDARAMLAAERSEAGLAGRATGLAERALERALRAALERYEAAGEDNDDEHNSAAPPPPRGEDPRALGAVREARAALDAGRYAPDAGDDRAAAAALVELVARAVAALEERS